MIVVDASVTTDALTQRDLRDLRRWLAERAPGRTRAHRPHDPPLRARMWALRDNVTSYDAAYVVLAKQLGCSLWTRDKPLAATVARQGDVEIF